MQAVELWLGLAGTAIKQFQGYIGLRRRILPQPEISVNLFNPCSEIDLYAFFAAAFFAFGFAGIASSATGGASTGFASSAGAASTGAASDGSGSLNSEYSFKILYQLMIFF